MAGQQESMWGSAIEVAFVTQVSELDIDALVVEAGLLDRYIEMSMPR